MRLIATLAASDVRYEAQSGPPRTPHRWSAYDPKRTFVNSCAWARLAARLSSAREVPHEAKLPEDFPVMPAETIGFRLLPRGFFTRNPALDVADQGR